MTYCSGKDNVCDAEFIVTIANVSLPAPGVVVHDYTDAPLAPQVLAMGILKKFDFKFLKIFISSPKLGQNKNTLSLGSILGWSNIW